MIQWEPAEMTRLRGRIFLFLIDSNIFLVDNRLLCRLLLTVLICNFETLPKRKYIPMTFLKSLL